MAIPIAFQACDVVLDMARLKYQLTIINYWLNNSGSINNYLTLSRQLAINKLFALSSEKKRMVIEELKKRLEPLP
ncbi:TPA: hypothetical protein HA361_00500 [Candidatus Woesearchaeota archaeon]|nr:hypothetical protein [Candidatus Woesearchaeota archaeon]